MLWYQNTIDGRLYMFDKGPTSTTVSASPKIITKGNSVMIEGSVMDQSPGKPNTPAIADEYMSEWMQHLYNNAEIPSDAKGVTVTLHTIDPNGNWINIDTVTSDTSGMFKKMWTPDIEGEYTVIATFEGSDSYWSSSAETAIGVGPAPSSSGAIEPETTEAPLITTEMAIIFAAVIVAIAVIAGFFILRKRK